MNHDDFTIIIDTREQQPWAFDHYVIANKKLDNGEYRGIRKFVSHRKKKKC